MAHSLLLVSAILLSYPKLRSPVAVRTMGLLREEIGTALGRAHQKLYRDEEELRAAEAEADEVLKELEAS